MSELFPKDPLPDLFIPGESAKKSITTQNFTIIVEYPLWPLLLVTLVGLSISCLIIWGFTIFRQEKIFRVSIDGIQKSYGMRPFSEVILKNQQGDRIGVLKRGLRKAIPIIDKGKQCTVRLI
jgi:plastocyanin domain-containing protein